jgi:cation transport regulator
MPYSSVEDLPEEVRSALPDGGQRIFLAAFNAAFEGTCKNDPDLEECANRVAWAAVKEKYEKSEDGKWTERTRKRQCPPGVFNCTAPLAESPGPLATLNVLDTFQRFPNPRFPEGLNLCYGAEAFAGTEPAWRSVPLIYAQTHPDGRQLLTDQPAALSSVKTVDGRPGRVVGSVENARIVREGQPRIEVSMKFTDPEVKRLWHESKLSLSSSIIAYDDPYPGMPENHRKVRPGVKPNHVLVFVRSPRDLPGDPGAMFLNNKQEIKEPTKMPEDIKPQPSSPIEQKLAEMDQELRNTKAAWNQAQSDIKTKDELIKVAKLDEQNRQWNRLAETLPRAWVHGEEEAKSRELFEKHPAEFVLKLTTALRETHAKEIEKAGEEYQRKTSKPPKKLVDVCTGLRVNGKAVGDES